jgi:hypothetical protein
MPRPLTAPRSRPPNDRPREERCERLALRDLGRVLQLCAPVQTSNKSVAT